MFVSLLTYTPDAERLVATAARLCYSAVDFHTLSRQTGTTDNRQMIDKVLALGHHGVLEHAVFSFAAEGVSRALTHQLVRHRLASFAQQSQRYVDFDNGFAYEMPPAIAGNHDMAARFDEAMRHLAELYVDLRAAGIAAEDARFVLPNAAHSRLLITMNARELRHFFRLRCCRRAQWEIRALAKLMLQEVLQVAPALFQKAGPGCLAGACPEGKMSCGAAAEVRREFTDLFADPAPFPDPA
ncbi:MAG: FAD-dependent thymidylate synthase [Deltaproteobacteria bacterium]|nr:FAD-dependent thymidylate synthase [Deltaproteobacteria bacterium]